MRAFCDRIDTLPLPAFFFVVALASSALGFLIYAFDGIDSGMVRWIGGVSVALAACATWHGLVERARMGSPEAYRALITALRTHTLPAVFDRLTWQRELARREQVHRRSGWSTPAVLICVLLQAVLLPIVDGVLRPSSCIWITLILVAMASWAFTRRRELADVTALQHKMAEAPAPTLV
jgi:hypothetical protein